MKNKNLSLWHQEFINFLENNNDSDLCETSVKVALDQFLSNQVDNYQSVASESLKKQLLDRMFGYGVITELLKDVSVSEIMVNSDSRIWIEKNGRLEMTNLQFESTAEVTNLARRLASDAGRRLDESEPLVDASLPDGSRLNAVIPPITRKAPSITIRRFPDKPFSLEQAFKFGTLNREMISFLSDVVKSRKSILISGATGSGKTSLLNALSEKIPRAERIVTIEDTLELRLEHPHVIQLQSRNSNIEGKGEITIRTLVKNSLRMRPDRIIVGEVRGAEVLDMLQALNTGHQGSLTTVHANSSREALERLGEMVMLTEIGLPYEVVVGQVARAFNFVVQVIRRESGVRRISEISQVIKDQKELGKYSLKPIFVYQEEFDCYEFRAD